MKKYINYILFFTFCNFLFAQKESYITYNVNPAPLGAKKIEIVYDISIPDVYNENVSGVIDFSLQIIDKEDINAPFAKGKEIAFFIETVTPSNKGICTSTYDLPPQLNLSENLPDNKIYRLISKDEALVLLNSKNPYFTNYIPISSKNIELSVGKSSKKSAIDVSFVDRPTVIERGNSFNINTIVNASIDDSQNQPSKVKFEIHIVNKEDVFKIEDVDSQRLVSDSGNSVAISNGTTNLDFRLIAPEIPSKFLPEGKTYRVRLYNDPCCEAKAYPFPFELITKKGKSEKSIFSKRTKVSVTPNPAEDYLTVNSTKRSSTYKIYDMSGSLVKQQNTLRRILVSDLKPGVYLLATDSGVARFTIK